MKVPTCLGVTAGDHLAALPKSERQVGLGKGTSP
jgi:hypothetical protein